MVRRQDTGKWKLQIHCQAKDKAGNSSADTVDFTVDKHTWKYLANPFVQPDSTTKPIIWNNYTTSDQRNAYLTTNYIMLINE